MKSSLILNFHPQGNHSSQQIQLTLAEGGKQKYFWRLFVSTSWVLQIVELFSKPIIWIMSGYNLLYNRSRRRISKCHSENCKCNLNVFLCSNLWNMGKWKMNCKSGKTEWNTSDAEVDSLHTGIRSFDLLMKWGSMCKLLLHLGW